MPEPGPSPAAGERKSLPPNPPVDLAPPRRGRPPEPDPFSAGPLAGNFISILYKVDREPENLTPEESAAWADYQERAGRAEASRGRLGLVDLADVMEEGATEPEMLVADLLVRSDHHLVYGTKESAKTWVMLRAALDVVGAGETVFWVDKEMGQRNLANRLAVLGALPEEVRDRVVYLEFPSLDARDDSVKLWTALLATRRPALVVFDAQTEVLADAGLNENSGTDIEKWSQAYITPARRIGAATVMIDHTGHTEGGRSVGSRQKGAAAKVELSVTKEKDFDKKTVGMVKIETTKNTVSAPIPKVQRYEIGGRDGRFVYEPAAGPAPTDSKRAEKRAKIEADVLKVLRANRDELPISQNAATKLMSVGSHAERHEALQSMAESDLSPVTRELVGKTGVRYGLDPEADAGRPV
jgi:hypothetical protein